MPNKFLNNNIFNHMESSSSSITASSYAGFGHRLVAYMIDGIITGIIYTAVLTPILTVLGLQIASDVQDASSMNTMTEEEATSAIVGLAGSIIGMVMMAVIAVYAIQILYYSIMESSRYQASLGKMAMGIKVVDLDGNRISFRTALLRAIGKILSQSIMWIGFIMAAFTDRKQGLHDIIAGTLVVKK
jgi:uncharacterized RDD family membrane protein YckC